MSIKQKNSFIIFLQDMERVYGDLSTVSHFLTNGTTPEFKQNWAGHVAPIREAYRELRARARPYLHTNEEGMGKRINARLCLIETLIGEAEAATRQYRD
jgi:hypothetical protein